MVSDRRIRGRMLVGYVWTGKFDFNTDTCGRRNFWIRKEKFADSKISENLWNMPHSHILMTGGRGGGGVRQRFIFYAPKNPNFRICLPQKIPTFFSIAKKIPQCFCISKFYYLSSGKLKHANSTLVLVKNKTINRAYVIFDLS